MNGQPMKTQPVSAETNILRDKYYAAKTAQSDLLDQLARDLIKLELAVPGIYVAVLKFVEGSTKKVPQSPWLYCVFGCWGLALLLTVVSLFPRQWKVNPMKIKADPNGEKGELSLEGFFQKTAGYKRRLLLGSTILFFAGVTLAAFLTVWR